MLVMLRIFSEVFPQIQLCSSALLISSQLVKLMADLLHCSGLNSSVETKNDIFLVVEKHLNPGLFNRRLFNHELFNPRLFNHEFLNHGDEKFMVEKPGVEMSGVEMSSL